MADGINIEGGLDDATLDFADAFKGNSIRDILGRFGSKLQEDLVRSLDSKGKNASSSLQQSIKFDVTILGSAFVFSLSMSDYWKWVDEGRKPGKRPPLEPIKQWVRTKAAFGGLNIKGTKEADSVAFLIARKIGKFGIKPSNFYSDVINDGRVEALEEELTKGFGNSILGIT